MKNNAFGGRRAVVLIFAVLLLGGLLWGLTSALAESGSPAPASAPPDSSGKITLRIGITREPDNMNVFLGYSAASFAVWYLNYDPLVGMNAADLSPSKESGLATDWEDVNGDGKLWRFTLRQDAVWHDGEPVTAEDVAFSYNYIIENDMYNWSSYTKLIKKATVIDDYTVEMECTDPKPSILNAWIPIIPEHIWSKVSPEDAEGNYKVKYPMIGSGPFSVVEWKKGDYLRMEANKEYWRGAPKIDEIIWQTYTNADSMSQELKAGTIDGATGLLGAQVKQFANIDGITVESVRVNGYDELGFNCYEGKSLGHPALRDPKFRQALQWAVDKQKISDIAYQGMAVPGDTVIISDYFDNPDWHWTPPAETAYTFDLEKAKAALEAAGYTDSDGNGIREYKGEDIELRLYPRSESQESVQAGKLIAGWFTDVGLKIDLQTIDEGTLTDKMYNTVGDEFVPDYDMFLWGWYNDVDPSIGLDYFTEAQINGWSDCAWTDPEYEKLQVEGIKETDITKRKEIIDRQQQIIYEQSPYIVLAYSNDIEGWNTAKWEGWVRSPAEVGNVIWPPYGNETYLFVQPKVGAEEEGGSNTTLYIIIGAVAVVVVIVLIMVLRRGKTQTIEE